MLPKSFVTVLGEKFKFSLVVYFRNQAFYDPVRNKWAVMHTICKGHNNNNNFPKMISCYFLNDLYIVSSSKVHRKIMYKRSDLIIIWHTHLVLLPCYGLKTKLKIKHKYIKFSDETVTASSLIRRVALYWRWHRLCKYFRLRKLNRLGP